MFVILIAICGWLVIGNGIEHSLPLLTALLLGAEITRWSDAGIRFFVGAAWVVLVIWFIVGLFVPDVRIGIGGP